MKKHDRIQAMVAGVLALALVPGVATAAAQRQVNETLEADPDVELSIELVVGDLEITGWDRDAVQITGAIGEHVQELDITGSRSRISIEAELEDHDDHWGGSRHRDYDVDLEIRVPRGARLDLEAVTAPISIRDVDGRISVESVSGDVEIEGDPEEIEVSIVSGSLDVIAGEVDRASFEAVSGNIRFEGSVSRSGRLEANTVSGRIELIVPEDIAADFDVESFSGTIDNEFGPEAKRTSRWVPSRELSFSNNGGGARIGLEALSGTIRIRKR